MQRGGSRVKEIGVFEFLGYPGGRTRKEQIHAYMELIAEAAERRIQEGRDDNPSHAISQTTALAEMPPFSGNPEKMARMLWINALNGYFDAALRYNIDLLKLEKPSWLKEATEQRKNWLAKSPAERYVAIETDRGAALVKQWKPEFDTIKDGANCLDVGCGSGFFVRHMQKQYPRQHWQATDLARDMPINGTGLDRSKADWFKPCEAGKPLPYGDASMDVITLNNVLHHVPPGQVKAFLQEVQRVLKPGGKLLVTEEFADMECEAVNGRLHGKTAAVHMPKYVDKVFWKDDPGHQHPAHQWLTTVASEARFNFSSENNLRVVGTFGTPGLPVMETCMVFTRVGENEWWHRGDGPYL